MKKIKICAAAIILLTPIICFSQGQTFTVAQSKAESDKKTTGNKADLLTNYIQVAANNLSSNNQNITLKLNWFALNVTDSATKYNDINYQKTRWQRNGQFTIGGGMDKNSRFNSVQGGVSYNVLNLRDTTQFHYFNYYEKAMDEIAAIRKQVTKDFTPKITNSLKTSISKILTDEFQKKQTDQFKPDLYNTIKSFPADKNTEFLLKPVQDAINADIVGAQLPSLKGSDDLAAYAASYMLDLAINKYITSFGKQSLSFDTYLDAALIKQITDAIDQQVQNNNLLKQEYQAKSLTDVNQKIESKYKDLVSYVARQPLVTAELNGNYGTGTTVSYIAGGFSGIWGLNKLGSKKTNQLTASLSDTLSEHLSDNIRTLNRNLGAATFGLNTVLVMDKNTSVMELNVGMEDDLLFSELKTGDKRNKFTFNTTYRVRLPNTPWLKLMIKYDPKAANVLGLLNFTYNLDNSSSSKK